MIQSIRSVAAIVLLVCLIGCQAHRPQSTDNPESIDAEYSGELDWKDWSAARSEWNREVFQPCLKASGIRMSCGGCASIYVKYIFTIDSDGRISFAQKYKDSACGRPMTPELENCFLKFYKAKQFPALKGRVFRGMIGNGLSC